MSIIKPIGHIFIAVVLTILTQVGGVIWLFALLVSQRKGWKKRFVFTSIYLIFNLVIIPPIAKAFGREALPWFNNEVTPRNWFYPLAFRNYVDSELKTVLFESAKTSGLKITYLDANFPFFKGFPLLPHLSHNDGKKIDISFMYVDEKGQSTNDKPSRSGYGAYVKKYSQSSKNCLNQGFWQYDFPKYLTFGANDDLEFDEKRTQGLIQSLLSKSQTQSIFIEPYLKQQLRLSKAYRIRFHGCRAVRHDDHIHLQIK